MFDTRLDTLITCNLGLGLIIAVGFFKYLNSLEDIKHELRDVWRKTCRKLECLEDKLDELEIEDDDEEKIELEDFPNWAYIQEDKTRHYYYENSYIPFVTSMAKLNTIQKFIDIT